MKINRRKFLYVAIPTAVVVAGAGATEYYIAPGVISQFLSKYLFNKNSGSNQQPTENILSLVQNVTPETVSKVYLTKNGVSKFSQSDSDLLYVAINLKNISDTQLEDVSLENYGLNGFLYKHALLGSPYMDEKDFVTISPLEGKDKLTFNLRSLPINKDSTLKVVYIPQQDAQDSLVTSKATTKYKDQNLSVNMSSNVKVNNVTHNLIDLELELFHDYHGDGAKQDNEPVITDAIFDIIDDVGNRVITGIKANGNGVYKIEDVKENTKYSLSFPDVYKNKYRNIGISNDEFYDIRRYQFTSTTGETKQKLGLMNGFLTLPFGKDTSYSIYYYFDQGKGIGWKGRRSYKGHPGTDFILPSETKLLAAAPGKIIASEVGWPKNPKTLEPEPGRLEAGNYITIGFNNGFRVFYCHISRPLVAYDQKVRRGEPVAIVGNTGTTTTHLHFQLTTNPVYGVWGTPIDPFGSESAWTRDNDPQYPL